MSSQKINENLYGQKEERSYIELQKGGGYFSKFEWQPDPYSLFMEAQSSERKERELKVLNMHENKPFIVEPKQPYRHRHQHIFHGKDF
jgi:hypothetical protein